MGILLSLAVTSNMIDAHVHVWADKNEKYARVPGKQDYPPPRFTPEDFFRHALPAGVGRAVLIQMSFYGFDNSYMLDRMRLYPRRFAGVGIVDSSASNPADAMIRLARQGVRGFRIQPEEPPQTWLDRPGMQSMWKSGAEENLAMCPLIGPDALASIDQMCTRFPDTPVVIDHLARIGSDGQIRDADVRSLCALAKHRNVRVKLSAFYALGRKQAPYQDLAPLIRSVFEAFGPRRLMWASDSPFQVQDGHTYRSSLALVQEGLPFLASEDKAWILEKTAEALFFRK